MNVTKKKIVFDDTDVRHAKLKIRLQHEGITQAEFFRALVTGYIEKDSSLVGYIKRYKLENNGKLPPHNHQSVRKKANSN